MKSSRKRGAAARGRKGAPARGRKQKEVYEVEDILDIRNSQKHGLQYFVTWKGYGPEESSWEPPENLFLCSDFIEKFLDRKAESAKWTFYHGVNSEGYNYGSSAFQGRLKTHKRKCIGLACVAFNTNGWIKTKLQPRARWTPICEDPMSFEGLYVLEPGSDQQAAAGATEKAPTLQASGSSNVAPSSSSSSDSKRKHKAQSESENSKKRQRVISKKKTTENVSSDTEHSSLRDHIESTSIVIIKRKNYDLMDTFTNELPKCIEKGFNKHVDEILQPLLKDPNFYQSEENRKRLKINEDDLKDPTVHKRKNTNERYHSKAQKDAKPARRRRKQTIAPINSPESSGRLERKSHEGDDQGRGCELDSDKRAPDLVEKQNSKDDVEPSGDTNTTKKPQRKIRKRPRPVPRRRKPKKTENNEETSESSSDKNSAQSSDGARMEDV